MRELREMTVEGARREQRKTEIVRLASDREYWKLEGCSSVTQWLARITNTEFGTAKRVAATSEALRSLPALDEALSTWRVDARSGRRRRAVRDGRDG